jgi:WD40 repeat protein
MAQDQDGPIRRNLYPAPAAIDDKPLPNGAIARMGSTLLRHGDAVSFAAYTPDGKSLATAGRDKVVRLWDLATEKMIRSFPWDGIENGKSEPIANGADQKWEQQFWDELARSSQAALSTDGKIVAASRGGAVRLWETDSGKTLGQFQTGEKRLLQLAFAKDGKSLLTLGPGQATAVWDVATGACIRSSPGKTEPIYFGPPGKIESNNAVVSPGLKYLAFSGREENGAVWLQICDLATGKDLRPIRTKPGIMALAFSPDDKTLVWDHPDEGFVFLTDVATGQELRRLKSKGRSSSEMAPDSASVIAFSPDGKRLAVSWFSGTIESWDLKSGKQMLPIGKMSPARFEQQSGNWINDMVRPALAFSPDSKKLVCSPGGGTVRQFQADTGAEISGTTAGHRTPVSTLALSVDGKSLCTYSPGDPVQCWDWSTGKETARLNLPADATQAVFAATGRMAFAAGHEFALCDAEGKQARKIAVGDFIPESLALSPDGTLLATRNFTHPEVHLWDATTLKPSYTLGRSDAPSAGGGMNETTGVLPTDLVFSFDGRYLAAAGPSRQLCVWDVTRGALLWEIPPQIGEAIERFVFSPNGRVLAAIDADHTVSLYEVVSGAKRARLGEPDAKLRRTYLTDGTWSPLCAVQMQRDAPVCLAFSPDGRHLAVAQNTPEIHLWDIAAGREVAQLKGHEGGVVSLLFAPDGKHLFSGGTDTTVLTWDLTHLPRPDVTAAAQLSPTAISGLWTDLASNDAALAFAAIRNLSGSPNQAITLLKDRVCPATSADPKRLDQLLRDLQNDRFEVRGQAQTELEGLGELAESALHKALAGDPSLDLQRRLEQLLNRLSSQTPGGRQLRELRALEALELVGGPEARHLLQALAGGAPEARLTREARGALSRLTK